MNESTKVELLAEVDGEVSLNMYEIEGEVSAGAACARAGVEFYCDVEKADSVEILECKVVENWSHALKLVLS